MLQSQNENNKEKKSIIFNKNFDLDKNGFIEFLNETKFTKDSKFLEKKLLDYVELRDVVFVDVENIDSKCKKSLNKISSWGIVINKFFSKDNDLYVILQTCNSLYTINVNVFSLFVYRIDKFEYFQRYHLVNCMKKFMDKHHQKVDDYLYKPPHGIMIKKGYREILEYLKKNQV